MNAFVCNTFFSSKGYKISKAKDQTLFYFMLLAFPLVPAQVVSNKYLIDIYYVFYNFYIKENFIISWIFKLLYILISISIYITDKE